jgi:hypothetical protein
MRLLLMVVCAPLVLAQGVPAQANRKLDPPPVYAAPRTALPPSIDGRGTEPQWGKAPVAELIFPWDSQKGAKQRTSVRLMWDETYLYALYECEDAEVTARHIQRDDPTYLDDAVELYLNPNPKQNTAYFGMEMNALGVMYDYFMAWPNAILLKRWNMTGYQLKTARTEKGWSLELALAWDEFADAGRRPASGSEWKTQFVRWDGVEPARRLSIWSDSGHERPNPHNPLRFGMLRLVE